MNEVERINHYLVGQYGYFDGIRPKFRVVFSDDQHEKRWTSYTDTGIELLNPEVRELRKYPYINGKYVLEHCLHVPPFVTTDLVDKFSYEPIWSFQDSKDNALPPNLDVCKLIIEQLHSQTKKSIGAKYKDPEMVDPKMAPEMQAARINKLKEELFGNDTDTGDALHYKEGIVVPNNYPSEDK